MPDEPKKANLEQINDILTIYGHSGIDTAPSDVIPIGRKKQRRIAVDIPEIKLTIARWLTAKQLVPCPASGLFVRAFNPETGTEANNFTPDYVWANMDVEGEFVDFEGLSEQRFMTILSQMFETLREHALNNLRRKLAPVDHVPDMNRAVRTAKMLLMYYGAKELADPDGDTLYYSSLMFVHCLWLVKRKLFDLPDYFPTMLTIWSAAEGSNKSGFLNELFAPLGAFKEHSTFRIFKDTFGCAPFGQYYALVFPEMRGVNNTSIEALKEILEQDQFVDRDMYTKLSCKTKRRATCFNTSNVPPPHGLKIDGAGRRFTSIHFSEIERQPKEIENFLRLIKNTALELWRDIDVTASPIIGEDFKAIRAQQRMNNRTEGMMDEFLETCCVRLDDKALGGDGIPLREFTARYKLFLADRRYAVKGALMQKHVEDQLTRSGGETVRMNSTTSARSVITHRFI